MRVPDSVDQSYLSKSSLPAEAEQVAGVSPGPGADARRSESAESVLRESSKELHELQLRLADVPEVRSDRVLAAQQRMMAGWYDRAEVATATAEAIVHGR